MRLRFMHLFLLALSIACHWISAQAASLSFNPPATVGLTSSNPSGLVVGDFNGDSVVDMAVAMSATTGGDGGISVLLGDGKGGFNSIDFATGNDNPWDIASGDFNRDGVLDLAVTYTNSASGTPVHGVNILLGHGNGKFTLRGSTRSLAAPLAVISGDFNGDNKLDLIVGTQSSTSLHLGDGLGGFGNPISVDGSDFMNASHLATGDFNNDGRLDFANSEAVFLNDGNAKFTRSALLGNGAIAVGHIDQDTKLDIVSVSMSSITVWLGKGDGTFTFGVSYDLKITLGHITIADFNADGQQDLAVTARDTNQIALLLGSTHGTFSAPLFFAAGVQPVLVAAADWNHDTLMDIAVPNNNLGDTPYVTLLLQRSSTLAPSAVDDTFSVALSSSNTLLNVLANDGVSGITGVVISALTRPDSGGTAMISSAADTLLYTPAPGFTGTETLSYTLRDTRLAQSGALVTVTVAGGAPERPPLANPDLFSVPANSSDNTLLVLGNDSDLDTHPLIITVDTSNQGGSASITVTGNALMYTPATGFVGTETFFYTLSDKGVSTRALVTVTVAGVTPQNHQPAALADNYTVNADTRDNTFNVLANDSDPDGNPLTLISIGERSQGGTVTINSGALLYTPAPGFTGTETFNYTIQDSAAVAATAQVSVTVTSNPAPVVPEPKKGSGCFGWLEWLIFAACFGLCQQIKPQRQRDETEHGRNSDCRCVQTGVKTVAVADHDT